MMLAGKKADLSLILLPTIFFPLKNAVDLANNALAWLVDVHYAKTMIGT
jgi:hypothetical protein